MISHTTSVDGSSWTSREALQYRLIGAIFFLLGACLIPFAVLHHPPWWFYCMLIGLLLPGLVALTASDGVVIDATTGTVARWWKVFGRRFERQRSLADFRGMQVRERVAIGAQHSSIRYDVVLTGSGKDMTVFTHDDRARADAERDRIAAVCPTLKE